MRSNLWLNPCDSEHTGMLCALERPRSHPAGGAVPVPCLMAGEQHASCRLTVRASPVHTLLLQVRLQPFFDYLSER